VNILVPLLAVAIMTLFALGGIWWFGLYSLFGIIIPYAAIALFLFGFVYRVLKWAQVPVPFHIPTVCGQQKSLPWIKDATIESPSSTAGVVWRMALEVLFFRSLLRNDKVELRSGEKKLVYKGNKWLWLGGLVLHWSLLIILFRHLRLFTEPVLGIVLFVRDIDSIAQNLLPAIFITDILVLAALTYLFFRRVGFPQMRYISLPADYFALLLIAAVAVSGVFTRLVFKVDIPAVKELSIGVLTLQPVIPAGLNPSFYIHLFFASALLAYFPYSKMMHAPGVFLSPTRNLKNNSRAARHVNPWSYPVKVHTYAEWEDEFRDKMKKVGLPVEKEE